MNHKNLDQKYKNLDSGTKFQSQVLYFRVKNKILESETKFQCQEQNFRVNTNNLDAPNKNLVSYTKNQIYNCLFLYDFLIEIQMFFNYVTFYSGLETDLFKKKHQG